ncbi:MAG TPA: hypothetical protein VGM57_14595 [Pseudolabrys sp.]|jgi:hypothetical protein
MKTPILTILAAAFLMVAAPVASYAQNPSADQEKGSTGWSGGSKDQPSQQAPGSQGNPVNATTGQKVEVHDEDKAKDQPPMATGEDLKGPARQFAPSQTPE